MLYALAGLAAGLIHVLSGPDHLAAVAPLSLDGRRKAWMTGLLWGVGHTSGVWLVAVIALALRHALPIEAISSWSERLVGAVLIFIGIWGLRRAFSLNVHVHEHEHDGTRHMHMHLHEPDVPHAVDSAHAHTHAAFAVGTLHGLAGSSHFLGVLPALAMPSTVSALVYIIAFGAGSIIAMSGFSFALSAICGKWGAGDKAYRWSLSGLSTAAIAVGIFWMAS